MQRRPSGSLLVSIALHIVLGAALLWVLSIPVPFKQWYERYRPTIPEEHITYVVPRAPAPTATAPTPGRSGGNGRPMTRHEAPPPPLTAPTRIPSTIPPAPPAGQNKQEPGTGPVIGKGGATAGVTPSFGDPRLWLPPGAQSFPPKSPTERLDSALASRIEAHRDSMAAIAAAAGKKPGDWTFEKNGKKYGIDQNKIYIGDHSIPTAILALLPLNSGTNPIENQRERALNFQRNEIMEQAQRGMNEAEFRDAVKKIRERKEREHQAALKKRDEERKKQRADSIVAQP
jgi:hypothetical protein